MTVPPPAAPAPSCAAPAPLPLHLREPARGGIHAIFPGKPVVAAMFVSHMVSVGAVADASALGGAAAMGAKVTQRNK